MSGNKLSRNNVYISYYLSINYICILIIFVAMN